MSFSNKKESRLRRARRSRLRIGSLGALRLSVFRSNRHIYAQIISPEGGQVLVSCSTLDKTMRPTCPHGADLAMARLVGSCLGEKAKAAGISKVAFDRSGYAYHGRVRALADAAREAGLEF